MKERNGYWCVPGLAICTLALTLALGPAASQGGILREVDKPPVEQQPPAEKQPSAEKQPHAEKQPSAEKPPPPEKPPAVPAKREGATGKSAPNDAAVLKVREKIFQIPGKFWTTAKVLTTGGSSKPPPAPGGSAGSHNLPRQGYACCNLHYDGDWISDSNYASLPMIAAGTPIEVLSYTKDRAYVKVDGKSMRLGHDYGRDQESLESWVNKVVVSDDPRARIGAFPPAVRDAIREGKVTPGMTREQAVVAIGYPLTSENSSLDAPVWRVWRSRRGEYQLNFRSDGHLASVSGDEEVTSQVLHRAGR